jgi:VCBS repeat-containing protein
MLKFINLVKLTSTSLLGILLVSTLASKPASANNALTVTIEAAKIQTAQSKTAAYTVDFNAQSGTAGFTKTNGTPNSPNYVYGGDLIIKTQDQWGGANATKYITQSKSTSSFNVKVNQDQKYFGFWWSAGDSANKIIFKNDGEEVAVFQTKDLVGFINSRPAAEKTLYYGNPNCLATSPTPTPCGSNTGHKAEPFAYVNVYFNSQAYDEIVIQTLSSSKFESDNHTFSAQIQTILGENVPQLASAANDLVSTSEDNSTTDNVLTNDSGESLSVLGVNLSPTQLSNKAVTNAGSQVTLASGALVKLNSDGTFTYNPNGKFESLNPGQTATDTFSYTIKDNQNNISTATVTMTINGAADTPDAVNDTARTDEDTSMTTTGNVKTNDTDPNGDALTVSMVNGAATNVGKSISTQKGALVKLNSDGTFTYDPNKKFEFLNDGQTATDTFEYTVDDGHGNTDTATVTITVDGVTDPMPD